MFEEVNYGMNKRNLWGPRKRRCCCQSGKAYKNISKKFGHKSTARQIVYKLSGPPTKITQKARHVIDPKVTSDTRSLCIQGKNDSVFLYIKNKVNRMSFGFEMLCFLREIMQTFGMSRNLEWGGILQFPTLNSWVKIWTWPLFWLLFFLILDLSFFS